MTEMMNENMILAQRPDYKTEIAEILRSSLTPKRMQERLQDYHENDIAAALELLKKEERSRLYSILQTDALASVLEYAGLQKEYMDELSIRKRVEILSRVEATAAVEYLVQLDKTERSGLIVLMDEQISGKQKLYLVGKEARVGLVNGLILARCLWSASACTSLR